MVDAACESSVPSQKGRPGRCLTITHICCGKGYLKVVNRVISV
jgi:hypothetical protein